MVNKIKLFKGIFFAIAGNGAFYFGSADIRPDLGSNDPNSILSDTSSNSSSSLNDDDNSVFDPTEFNNPQFTVMRISRFLKERALKNFLEENSSSDSIGIKRDGQYCVFDNENQDIICKIDKNDNTIYVRDDNQWKKLDLNQKLSRRPLFCTLTRSLPAQ